MIDLTYKELGILLVAVGKMIDEQKCYRTVPPIELGSWTELIDKLVDIRFNYHNKNNHHQKQPCNHESDGHIWKKYACGDEEFKNCRKCDSIYK